MGIVVFGASFVDIKGYPLANYIPAGRNEGRVQQVYGGVCRNVVENIANVELRPTFVSLVDESGIGKDVIEALKKCRVDTRYMRCVKGGLGTWLAVFDNTGDVVASISQRPDFSPVLDILDEYGDEIISAADSVVVEFDMDKEVVNRVFQLAEKYHKEVYAVISNMSIAIRWRDLLKKTACMVCNRQEAGIFFSENYEDFTPAQMEDKLAERIRQAGIARMVVTMGSEGAVYADCSGIKGFAPPQKVDVMDTTGAGDAFFSGIAIGMTYGKTLAESCAIGTRLASAVIGTSENVCPRFQPGELGLDVAIQP